MPEILGISIDPLTQTEALHTIAGYIVSGTPRHIVTANAEIIYSASQDPEMAAALKAADMVTADGSGVVLAAKLLGAPLPARVTGIDLALAICAESANRGWRIYLLGAAPGVAQAASDTLRRDYPGCQIVGSHHGYFTADEEPAILADIRQAAPDILMVAFGAPRQEYWIRDHKIALQVPVSIGIGGSLDVISGRLKRAPGWVRAIHMEWLYRILREPKRLKRATSLPKFVLAVCREKIS